MSLDIQSVFHIIFDNYHFIKTQSNIQSIEPFKYAMVSYRKIWIHFKK